MTHHANRGTNLTPQLTMWLFQ